MPDIADVKPRSLDLREKCQETGAKVAELRSIPRDKRTDEQNTELKAFAAELGALDLEFQNACNTERFDMERSKWDAEVRAAAAQAEKRAAGPMAAFDDTSDRTPQTMGEIATHDADFRSKLSERIEGFAGGGAGVRVPHLGEKRTLIDSAVTGSVNAGLWRPVGTPYAPVPRQMRMFVRDLMNVQETGLSAVPYIRELTPATNETGASSVAEGVAKPEVTMAFESDTAIVRKLAAWVPVTEEILDDAPTLRSYIDNRLTYMLKFREQDEIIRGNGVAPDLKGILNFTGVQTQGATTNDAAVDFGLAIGKIELVDGDADGIVMNPGDFWAMTTLRHTTFFDANVNGNGNAPFGTPDQTIWGLPVVRTRAMATTHALVGDWRMGATLFDRMQTNIRTSDSHDTFFILNKIAILIEERVALACERPDFFVNTTIDPS
jgi:hypothetical protein